MWNRTENLTKLCFFNTQFIHFDLDQFTFLSPRVDLIRLIYAYLGSVSQPKNH